MQYISDRFSRLTTFKRRRTESPTNSEDSPASLEVPQKRFKLDYAYIISSPITTVFSLTKRLMATPTPPATPQVEAGVGPSSPPAPVPSSIPVPSKSTVSVQTTPPVLSTSDQRQALRKHVIKKSTIHDVIQLEQREKYRQLLKNYTVSNNTLYDSISLPTAPLHQSKLAERYNLVDKSSSEETINRTVCHAKLGPGRYMTSTPARPPVTSMSPPSSDSGTGSGSEASGPVYQNKRMIKEAVPKKQTWTNPFDKKWLENWHKILTENLSVTEQEIAETKKSLEDAKKEGLKHHESLDKLVEKDLSGDVSEDEAIGDELDSFPPLTEDMMEEVERCLTGGPMMETLVEAFNIALTRKDMITLKDLTWLNDEVINFYFNLLMERSKKVEPTIHIFNTFFYPRLLKVGHQGLARWTRRVDLFAVDLIMIPIHLGMHWCLAVIDMRAKTVTYYDSLLGDNHQCTTALRDYIAAEHLAKKKTPLDLKEWKCVIRKDLPEQLNGCDCGVFTCKYAEYISQDKSFDFDQSDMPYFRRRMIWEIVNKTLL